MRSLACLTVGAIIVQLFVCTDESFSQRKPLLIDGANVEAVTFTSGGGYKNINTGFEFTAEIKRFRIGAGIFLSGLARPYLNDYYTSNFHTGVVVRLAYMLKHRPESDHRFGISLSYLLQSFRVDEHYPELDTVFNEIRDRSKIETTEFHECYASFDYINILSSRFYLHGSLGAGVCFVENETRTKPFWSTLKVVNEKDVRFGMIFKIGVAYMIKS